MWRAEVTEVEDGGELRVRLWDGTPLHPERSLTLAEYLRMAEGELCNSEQWGPAHGVLRMLEAAEADRRRPASESVVPPVDWPVVFGGEGGEAHTKLMPHQRQTIEEVVRVHNGRCIIGFEQGTGKTAVGCGLAAHYPAPALFIVPGAKLADWQAEFHAWTGRAIRVVRSSAESIFRERVEVPAGEGERPRKRPRKESVSCDPNVMYIAISFDLACRHEEVLQRVDWHTVVVDEAHKLKNTETLRAQRLLPLLQRARSVLLLTGTPEESRPSELFALLNALHPAAFPCRVKYASRYCEGRLNAWGQWEETGAKHLGELRAVLSRCMVRYRKAEVLQELPPKVRVLVRFRMRDAADIAAFAKEKAVARRLREEESCATDPATQRRKRMERNCQSTLLWRMSEDLKARIALPWLTTLLSQEATRTDKVIVFCVHLTNIARIRECLEDLGVGFVEVTGRVPPSRRMQTLQPFLSDAATRVALLSLDSCAEALNLAVARHVVFFGMARKPGAMEQAEDRAHRKGATGPVRCYWLFVEDSHDQNVLRRNIEKARVNAAVVDAPMYHLPALRGAEFGSYFQETWEVD